MALNPVYQLLKCEHLSYKLLVQPFCICIILYRIMHESYRLALFSWNLSQLELLLREWISSFSDQITSFKGNTYLEKNLEPEKPNVFSSSALP